MKQLSKTSSSEEIKMYFNAILKLAKASEEFPVNFDEVWMLVYNRRDYAVDALKKDCIEGVDYVCTSVKTEVGSNKFDSELTVACMEFFIARKVRDVFEVYRKVFHKAAEHAKQLKSPTPTKVRASLEWVKGVKDLLNLNDSSILSMIKQVGDPLGLPTPDYIQSKGILKSAGDLLKENGLSISAQAFNQKMIEKGYIVELTRPSSKGVVKKFKSITGEGLNFGENQVNPNNPKSTQPLYYEDKFFKLLTLLDLKQIA